ncbi:EamA family transporter [Aurantibacter aestuarii]|uniref:EamA family transporter n=1 Tax=Aurantibacter aestuarii TaxID=1266046 RepID=A0A2T1N8I8_9FLAO|nr:EamA family transporter [Aurantibacter aestuarii]PSG88176.1 EamA family transporter [Aurantibacter aestuarii]
MKAPSSKILIVLAFFSIYIIWGSTYLFNKIAVTELPALYLAAIRFCFAGLLIIVLAKLFKMNLKISKKQFINSIIAGFLFLVYGNGVFVWALNYLDSGFAALLASTQPLFVLILMRIIDRKPIKKKSIIGVTLGLLGMYLLVSQNDITTKTGTVLGIFMVFTCVFSWSYGSVFVSKADLPKNFFVATGYQMLTASVILGIGSLLFKEQWISPLDWSIKVKGAMLFLIVFGGIVAFTAFNYLLKQVSTDKVASSSYVNPVIAMLLGYTILDESLSTQSIIASAILLLGVYFITSRKEKRPVKPKI